MAYEMSLQHTSAATVASVISHTAVRGLKKAKKKVAEELSAQQLDEFKDVFADLEKDGDGSVTTKGIEPSIFLVQNNQSQAYYKLNPQTGSWAKFKNFLVELEFIAPSLRR